MILLLILLAQYQPSDPYHYQENLRQWEQQQQEQFRFREDVERNRRQAEDYDYRPRERYEDRGRDAGDD